MYCSMYINIFDSTQIARSNQIRIIIVQITSQLFELVLIYSAKGLFRVNIDSIYLAIYWLMVMMILIGKIHQNCYSLKVIKTISLRFKFLNIADFI